MQAYILIFILDVLLPASIKEERSMTTMDQIHRIRELYYGQGKSLTEIANLMDLDWRTVRKYVDKTLVSGSAP